MSTRGMLLSDIRNRGERYSSVNEAAPTVFRSSIIGDPSNNKLYKLLHSKQFSDYTIIFRGQEFQVHKCILASSCEYFATYFNSSENEGAWKESTSSISVSFEFEVPITAFVNFLTFLYTDTISDETMKEYAMVMYELGDFFMKMDLLVACCPYLEDMLSISNCQHLLPWMQSKENDLLDSIAARFIHSHKGALIETDFKFVDLGERIIRNLIFENQYLPPPPKSISLADRIRAAKERVENKQSVQPFIY